MPTKYKNFTIQGRRARLKNFCIIIDFEYEIVGDTTLKNVFKKSMLNIYHLVE